MRLPRNNGMRIAHKGFGGKSHFGAVTWRRFGCTRSIMETSSILASAQVSTGLELERSPAAFPLTLTLSPQAPRERVR